MNHLVPCPECSRHVRVSETECPFCALPLDLASTPPPQLPRGRLSRAATLAFGATLVSATAISACGGDAEQSGGPSDAGAAGVSIGGAVASYGGPAGGQFGISGSGGAGGIPPLGAAGAIYGAAGAPL